MRVAHRGWVAVAVALLLVGTAIGPAMAVADATPPTRDAVREPAPAAVRSSETAGATAPTAQMDAAVATGEMTRPATAVSRRPSAATFQQLDESDVIRQTQTYALTPERPGDVSVAVAYEIPDRVVGLTTAMPENATVTGWDGFTRVNETHFRWDGNTPTATIDFRIDPNRTVDRSGLETADGEYIAADAGEWALISRSRTPTGWRYIGQDPVVFEQNVTTDGPGAAGDQLVYLGPVQTYERTANEQTFRLAVPERATLTESPDEILDSLTNASDALRVGDRDETVFVVAAPTGEVAWGVRGLETGGSDFWVRDAERLDTAENVWIHEYVHTRQTFETTRDTRWLTEGTAVYYAAMLTLEQERIDFAEFRDTLADGQRDVYADVVLADPATWTANANYVKGPLVAGRIDGEIRTTTESESTFQETVRVLNGVNQPVTQEVLLASVERSGDVESRAEAREYTQTTSPVTMWNETYHARVFGQLPARIGYSLPDADGSGYHVSGPYRTTNVTDTTPIRLATGETLTVDALVSNAGGTEGTYNATLDINGTAVTTERGRIAPSTQLVVPLSQTFVTPGTYTLSVDGDNVTVVVERPARATVTDIEVSSTTATQGGSVVVTATVENDAAVPATGTVVFTRNYQQVSERTVYLPPENTTRVSSGIDLPQAGDVVVSAGTAMPVSITVAPSNTSDPTPTATTTTTPTESGTTDADGPGFTAATAALAVVLALVGLLARRR
ncbi:peptidase [Haloarcula marina]|uniref:peptidase n=1 Tax=Haloarcula marina TaxID=2961574 RepID=UPI0020B7C996|nr:peptidase [Halomicroarcula marina]